MRLGRRKYTRIDIKTFDQGKIVKVVADPVIATAGRVNGKLIPLLILDTTERPDLAELVRVHQNFVEGDVTVQWGALEGRLDHIALFLRFLRPAERIAIIEFEITKQGALVDQILTAGAVYLQPGKPGDKLLHDLEVPKVIVEIPDTGFRSYWEKIYLKSVFGQLRKSGLTRAEAQKAASDVVSRMREIGNFQVT
ncbi:UNVERIFIED_ORG: hypothetical protein GGE64_001207 [Rhizobium etli]|uniref:hypothetical protein n=1 Tax=Rhizobium TaxID=379 RepID=UPI00098FD90A|nr:MULTISPECIES: hypothetical protein [Rhizobium]ARQ61134.1 hypothetical protein Kim5_PB00170 [Rhizobium sp. Kim5]RSC11642.1 hypothetical protein EFR00_07130 [Rhizobium sophoriradicis]